MRYLVSGRGVHLGIFGGLTGRMTIEVHPISPLAARHLASGSIDVRIPDESTRQKVLKALDITSPLPYTPASTRYSHGDELLVADILEDADGQHRVEFSFVELLPPLPWDAVVDAYRPSETLEAFAVRGENAERVFEVAEMAMILGDNRSPAFEVAAKPRIKTMFKVRQAEQNSRIT